MPPISHTRPPPGLGNWLASGQAGQGSSVRQIVIDDVRCVVKRRSPGLGRAASYVVRYLRAAMLAGGCRVFLGELPNPGVLLRNGLGHEAQRLRFLGQAGCRVPDVWHRQAGLLVLEHVGEGLPGLIRRADEPAQRELVRAVALDLAEFHERGFWHGGAQLRNMTLRDGQLWRIDFEENIGGALSLPLAQAYDVFQALSSIQSLRKVPVQRLPALGELALRTYLEARPDPAVRAALRRIAGMLSRADRLLGAWGRRSPWRDVHTFFQLADTLRLVLLDDEYARRLSA